MTPKYTTTPADNHKYEICVFAKVDGGSEYTYMNCKYLPITAPSYEHDG